MAFFIGSLINQPLKITKESDNCYLPDASFECKDIVEIEFWLTTARTKHSSCTDTRANIYAYP